MDSGKCFEDLVAVVGQVEFLECFVGDLGERVGVPLVDVVDGGAVDDGGEVAQLAAVLGVRGRQRHHDVQLALEDLGPGQQRVVLRLVQPQLLALHLRHFEHLLQFIFAEQVRDVLRVQQLGYVFHHD